MDAGLAFRVFLVLVTAGSFMVQVLRIRRFGPAGVSRSTWLGLLVSVTLWATYGLAVGDWTILVANLPVIPVAWAVVHAMARAGAARVIDAPLALGATVLGGQLALPTIGPAAVGAAAATLVVVRILPQLVEAVRAPDVAGISVTTWWGNIANKVPWTIYGLVLIDDLWVGGAAALAVALSGAIVVVVLVRRRGVAVPVSEPVRVDGVGSV